MKIAVVFHGLVQRSLKHVSESVFSNLLTPLAGLGSVDVFFHSWKTGPLTNPRAGEHSVTPDPADIEKFLPMAKGRTDDESEFCRIIDWAPVHEVNPMRFHCDSEESAKVAIRNVILSLHSLEMAFDIMLEQSESRPDIVVVSRCDIRFLHPIAFPNEIPGWTVFLPSFHSWGGVNDRFAFGTCDAMEVYARRSSFFDGWMLNPTRQNPEWILMKWLQRNRIDVRQIEYPFQRIRADGTVFPLDQSLS